MEKRSLWLEWMAFSRKDRLGVLVLVIIAGVVATAPNWYISKVKESEIEDKSWLMAVERLREEAVVKNNPEKKEWSGGQKNYEKREKKTSLLFPFDPNTVSPEGWKKLGLRDKTIQTVMKFRDKGGKFYTTDDLKKIYGLFRDEYERLAPYVQIASIREEKPAYTPSVASYKPVFTRKSVQAIDINSADTTAWIALPGIGSKLASRIVLFREKLGGFYKVEQVGETFGLADSVFNKLLPYLKLTEKGIRKIALNAATFDELKNHPYIRYQLARLIINYRNSHGTFKDPEELKKIIGITDEVFIKVKPYLEIL